MSDDNGDRKFTSGGRFDIGCPPSGLRADVKSSLLPMFGTRREGRKPHAATRMGRSSIEIPSLIASSRC